MPAFAGHWSYGATHYRKLVSLTHQIATYKKPLISLINGMVMGAGAGLSINTRFRVVTQNTVFAMPEVFLGFFPDVGASRFLSRLPGYFGEYIGLTGARLDGAEMVACGLATHFISSRKLKSLENALQAVTNSDIATITKLIDKFTESVDVKEDSSLRRLETINRCFSRKTVEEIVQSLENESEKGEEKWIKDSLHAMRSSCPLSLKIFLKSIREGRQEQDIGQCLAREYNIGSHFIRRTFSNDLYEGIRAKLVVKDNKAKWEPARLELVSDEMVNQHFRNVEDEDWQCLMVLDRYKAISKL
ncbi:hypothetical protein L6164_000102 [Bauhinia variegata]|uniref:Uncharacterized protein n=1 Tax=Bauhinia variegata TaxID=167791 RepID=A0ACB9Q4Z9_BAUVA|nr:hypothetical protein L6164_000102 [Bauhinia variegata]